MAERNTRVSASVPAHVLSPNWCGKQARWKCGAKPWARVRPTRRRKTSPTTSARTPRPPGFCSATILPTRKAARAGVGTSACAKRQAARCRSCVSPSSSSKCANARLWPRTAQKRLPAEMVLSKNWRWSGRGNRCKSATHRMLEPLEQQKAGHQ